MKIYLDGSGFNGKTSGYAVVFEDGRPPIVRILHEKKTNNEMEYAALLEAILHASPKDHLYTDSQLLVGQVTLQWKVKAAHLKPLVQKAKKMVFEKNVSLSWVPRALNQAGKLFE
jgi:ribonuclease HI